MGPHDEIDLAAPERRQLTESWFSAAEDEAGSARHAVRRVLVEEVDLRLVEEVELLTTELFKHTVSLAGGSGRVRVRVQQSERRVHVEVAHQPNGATEQSTDDTDDLDPRERAILDRLLDSFADRWGRDAEGGGPAATWFEMRV